MIYNNDRTHPVPEFYNIITEKSHVTIKNFVLQ